MDDFAVRQQAKALRTYGVEDSTPTGNEESVDAPEPISHMSATLGSAQQRLAWKTKSLAGASLSATNFGSVVNWNAGQQPQQG